MNLKSVIFISILICGLLIGPVSAAAGDTILFEQVNISSNITQIWNNGSFQVYPVVQGVTTTDSVDQSLDSGWAAANTYALGTSVSESATNLQTFTPTKNKITKIAVYSTATGTAVTWYLVVHDASNNVLASSSLVPSGTGVQTFDVPCLWDSGNLHFHVYASATTGTPTLKSGTSNDLETGSYIQYYAKNTESTNITVNGQTMMLDTGDATGLVSGATVDTLKGFFTYDSTNLSVISNVNGLNTFTQTFYTTNYGGFNDNPSTQRAVVNGWYGGNGIGIYPRGNDAERMLIFKINTILPVTCVNITPRFYEEQSVHKYLQISIDNSTWTTLLDYTRVQAANWNETSVITHAVDGYNTFYIRFYKPSGVDYSPALGRLQINATLNTTGTNATVLTYQNGDNLVNITSYGNAVSSSLDPSLQANVSLIEGAATNSITANFSVSNTTGFEPLLTHFTDTSTVSGATIDSWQWDFGDGNTSTTQSPDHLYEVPGTHTVNLTITNTSLSLVSTKLGSVTVYKVPVADFSSFNTQGTAPFTTYLYDTSTNLNAGPYTYYWDLGDGNTSTSQNLYYTWNITGTYDVKHCITDSVTTACNNKTAYVTVGTAVDAPVASFYGGPQLGAPPLQVFFTDVSTNTPTSWFWEFGDGTNSTSRNPEHYFNRSGFYTVNLTVANTAGSNMTTQKNFIMVY